jgi:hypothetical protein
LGHAARPGDSHGLPIQAKVVTIIQTVKAIVTCDVGFDRHPITNLKAGDVFADLFDESRKLVSWYHGIVAQVLSAEDMNISTTNATSHHFDQYFGLSGLWYWDVYHLYVIGFFNPGCSDDVPPDPASNNLELHRLDFGSHLVRFARYDLVL